MNRRFTEEENSKWRRHAYLHSGGIIYNTTGEHWVFYQDRMGCRTTLMVAPGQAIQIDELSDENKEKLKRIWFAHEERGEAFMVGTDASLSYCKCGVPWRYVCHEPCVSQKPGRLNAVSALRTELREKDEKIAELERENEELWAANQSLRENSKIWSKALAVTAVDHENKEISYGAGEEAEEPPPYRPTLGDLLCEPHPDLMVGNMPAGVDAMIVPAGAWGIPSMAAIAAAYERVVASVKALEDSPGIFVAKVKCDCGAEKTYGAGTSTHSDWCSVRG